jgi:ABC-type sugar transport system ATPase subunit
MNFIRCRRESVSGKNILKHFGGSCSIDLSPVEGRFVGIRIPEEVVVGIRPENVEVGPDAPLANMWDAIVLRVEPLGPELVIEVALEGEKENIVRILADPREMPPIGKNIQINFRADKIHLIDPTTQKVLI